MNLVLFDDAVLHVCRPPVCNISTPTFIISNFGLGGPEGEMREPMAQLLEASAASRRIPAAVRCWSAWEGAASSPWRASPPSSTARPGFFWERSGSLGSRCAPCQPGSLEHPREPALWLAGAQNGPPGTASR